MAHNIESGKTASEQELKTTLVSMMELIRSGAEASADGESLAQLVGRIDELKLEMTGSAPPMLQHYLEKRSYAKALDFLEGRDETSEPNC